MNRIWMWVVGACWILGVGAGGAWAADVTVVKVDGEDLTGRLESVDAQGSIGVAGQVLKLGDVAEIRFLGVVRGGAKDKPKVFLRNGDLLYASVTSGNDASLKVNSSLLGDLEIKNVALKGIVFPIKEPPPESQVEAFLAGEEPKEDRVLTPKGETVSGFQEKFTDKELVFEAGGQKRSYAFEQLAGYRCANVEKLPALEGAGVAVSLADGSSVSGRLAGLAEENLLLRTAQGTDWKLPLSAVVALGIRGGRLVYLSELNPQVEERPYVGGEPVVLGWRRDESVSGEPLRIGKKEYARGVGVHSFCRLSYELEGAYARLYADVGLDVSAGSGAICAWKVLADGKDLEAGEVRAGDAPRKLKLSLEGVRKLELICDFGSDQDDAGDHLDWADARLVRK